MVTKAPWKCLGWVLCRGLGVQTHLVKRKTHRCLSPNDQVSPRGRQGLWPLLGFTLDSQRE